MTRPGEPERALPAGVAAGARVRLWYRLGLFLAVMGPGLVTGVVDDDPTGIAGYSLAGARHGYSLIWVLILSTLALAVVHEMVARMGVVTGKGLADLIRESFGLRTTFLAMATLLVANMTTTVAEFAGVAAASEIFGVSRYISVPIAAVVVFGGVALGSYRRFEIFLILGSLFLFVCYVVTGFLAKPDWGQVAQGSFVPTLRPTLGYFTIVIGIIGTTITPWQQFYLQSAVVDKGLSEREYALTKLDVYLGAIVMSIVGFFIILTTAATLWAHGQPADTVTDVAQALRPLAGEEAERFFALGLLSAAIMAAAVIPLSSAYSVCEAFGWERSVNRSPREAPAFFGLFAAQMVLGAIAVLIPGVPLLALLFLPNVVGGMLLPIILVLMLKLVNDRRLMGKMANSRGQNFVAWATTVMIICLTGAYLGIAALQALGVIRA